MPQRFSAALGGLRRVWRGVAAALLVAAIWLAVSAAPVTAQTESAPAPQGCATPLPGGFSQTEQAAWAAICESGYYDASTSDEAGCASTGDDDWPERRSISQAFLETILFREPYKSLRRGESVQIRCAVFPETINFAYREIEPALLLDDSRMPAGVSLFNTRARRLLSFRGDKIEGDINGDRLQIEDNFFSRGGTRISGRLTLSGAKMGGNVEAGGSTYQNGVNLDAATVEGTVFVNGGAWLGGELRLVAAHVGRTVDASGSTFNGPVNLDSSRIGGGVFLNKEAKYNDQVVLRAARVGGGVEASTSTFGGEFTLDRATIEGSVFTRNATFNNNLVFASAQIGANVELGAAVVGGSFNAESMKLDKTLYLNDGVVFKSPVYLRYSEIGGNIAADGATFENGFYATGLRVNRSIQLRNKASVQTGLWLDAAEIADSLLLSKATLGGQVVLEGAKIGANIDLDGAVFEGVLNGESMKLEQTLSMNGGVVFKAPVYLRYGEIDGNLAADAATFEGGLYATGLRVGRSIQLQRDTIVHEGLWLDAAEIADSLFLSGATLDGRINLQGASIGNELGLSDPNYGDPVFKENAFVVLRNTRVGALRARPEAWRREDGEDLPTDLVGFAYERESSLDSREMESMLLAPARQLIKWLASQRGPDGAPHDASYNPQPYEQLQAALIREGRFEKARAIKYAQFEHYRRAQTTPELRKYGMLVLKYLAGYGVYPVLAVFWFAGLVLLGALVGHFSPGLAGCTSAEVFWYSFDNALPLVELSENNKRVVHERDWVTTFFHGQRIFGLVLATALIGAVSLL